MAASVKTIKAVCKPIAAEYHIFLRRYRECRGSVSVKEALRALDALGWTVDGGELHASFIDMERFFIIHTQLSEALPGGPPSVEWLVAAKRSSIARQCTVLAVPEVAAWIAGIDTNAMSLTPTESNGVVEDRVQSVMLAIEAWCS